MNTFLSPNIQMLQNGDDQFLVETAYSALLMMIRSSNEADADDVIAAMQGIINRDEGTSRAKLAAEIMHAYKAAKSNGTLLPSLAPATKATSQPAAKPIALDAEVNEEDQSNPEVREMRRTTVGILMLQKLTLAEKIEVANTLTLPQVAKTLQTTGNIVGQSAVDFARKFEIWSRDNGELLNVEKWLRWQIKRRLDEGIDPKQIEIEMKQFLLSSPLLEDQSRVYHFNDGWHDLNEPVVKALILNLPDQVSNLVKSKMGLIARATALFKEIFPS